MTGSSLHLDADVIIVGAGPVGLLTALKMGLGGVKTLVIEKYPQVLEAPRAIAYLPTVNKELAKMGILDAILEHAHRSNLGPCWRKLDGTMLAGIGQDDQQDTVPHDIEYIKANIDQFTLMIGQDLLSKILLDHIHKNLSGVVAINFSTACVGIQPSQDDGNLVEVLASKSSGGNEDPEEVLLRAKWVVGADGSNSFVRKAVCIPFEGVTWRSFRFTASDVEYKFDREGGYRPINYITDPEEWAIIAKAGVGDVWRICYGERTHLPEDDASLVERSQQRILRYLPGSKEYKLRRVKPYWARQHCAKTFQKGKVVLVGDAAHSNNPVGGLGLTSGILDAVVLGNVMIRCLRKNENEDLISVALETRRSVWLEQVNPATQANFKRLYSNDPETEREREEYFSKVNSDPLFPAQLGREIDDLFRNNFESQESVSNGTEH